MCVVIVHDQTSLASALHKFFHIQEIWMDVNSSHIRFAKLTCFSVGLDFLLLVQNSLWLCHPPLCPSPFCSFFTWSPFNFPLHKVAHELGEPTHERRLVAAIIAFSLCMSANSSGSFNSHPPYLAGKWVSMD